MARAKILAATKSLPMLYFNEDAVKHQIELCQELSDNRRFAQGTKCKECNRLQSRLCPLAIARSKPLN